MNIADCHDDALFFFGRGDQSVREVPPAIAEVGSVQVGDPFRLRV
ncbi:MAG: hypothetical protein ABI947_02525 [Chloroflexota bacterium]